MAPDFKLFPFNRATINQQDTLSDLTEMGFSQQVNVDAITNNFSALHCRPAWPNKRVF